MIRIVGVQRNESPGNEFVLLQNQGNLRVNLRGHLIVSEQSVQQGDLSHSAHVFNDEALVPAGMYILLVTGYGEPRWSKTKDGAMIYTTYMNREISVWNHQDGPLHVLSTQHTYTERKPSLVLR